MLRVEVNGVFARQLRHLGLSHGEAGLLDLLQDLTQVGHPVGLDHGKRRLVDRAQTLARRIVAVICKEF